MKLSVSTFVFKEAEHYPERLKNELIQTSSTLNPAESEQVNLCDKWRMTNLTSAIVLSSRNNPSIGFKVTRIKEEANCRTWHTHLSF